MDQRISAWLNTAAPIDLEAQRLQPDGVYTMNVIDYGPRSFLRAQLATVGAVFDHVAVLGRPGAFDETGRQVGGNYVVIASDAPLPVEAIRAANARRGRTDDLLVGSELTRFVGDAQVLTDDHAPVDQLLTPRPNG